MLILVLAFSLGLTAVLSFVKFDKALTDVMLSRREATVRNLVDNIETGLNLGLSLAEIQNYRRLVERAIQEHGDLLVAEVQDTNGRRVFSHAQSGTRIFVRPGTEVPQGRASWTSINDQSVVLGQQLVNPFGRPVGILVVEFSRHSHDQALKDIRNFMIETWGAIIAVGAVLSLLVAQVLVRPFRRSLESIEHVVGMVGTAAAEDSGSAAGIETVTTLVASEIRSIGARGEA